MCAAAKKNGQKNSPDTYYARDRVNVCERDSGWTIPCHVPTGGHAKLNVAFCREGVCAFSRKYAKRNKSIMKYLARMVVAESYKAPVPALLAEHTGPVETYVLLFFLGFWGGFSIHHGLA